METILYKPLFINPQAYYVFPNINGRLEPKTGSGKEPAMFIGNIEVKTIAHGDIGKKQYFYNTNEIDLSAFSNSLVRISLYTNRGNVVLGEWDLDIIEGESENYIDPEVLASLVAVCICDGKSNDDPDRAVIKNLVDPDNPFVISNAAYEGMSGHNGYPFVFGANKTWKQLPTYNSIYSINDNKIHITKVLGANRGLIFSYVKQNDQLSDITEIPSFKIRVSGLKGDSKLRYSYIKTENAVYQNLLDLDNGIHKLPKSLRPTDSIVNESWIGFTITPIVENEITFDCDITIEVLPEYEGAFVTDGKDDLITSTKTVKEMLGGSSEITVVSMMLNLENEKITYTNQIRPFQNGYIRNNVISNTGGKYGIYGYKITDISDIFKTTIGINDILGDRKDCSRDVGGTTRIDGKFSVEGYCFNDGTIGEVSQVAWYWTIISKIALTTDQINQVISYFNLDKHVKPDVYYDVKKQGLSNDTPEADWYLKDFSGNGHDMQLYNFAKKLGSGIGKYEADYSTWTKTAGVISTPFGLKITEPTHNYWILYTSNITVPAHKVKISGIPEGGEFRYLGIHILKNGINELPKMEEHPSAIGFTLTRGTTQPSDWVGLSVEQIPDYEGALVSDGINDYGYADNLPIYKDYTVVADYARLKYGVIDSAIVSKSYIVNNGAFAFNLASGISPKNVSVISFGVGSPQIQNDDNYRKIRYQSKYINDSVNISAGTGIDSDKLWISCLRENKAFSESALYSILLFPYTLSEFLIERQLKRYSWGTLYPDMVEFRPIINVNIGKTYNVFEIRRTDTNELLYYYINGSVPNNKIGSYLPKGTNIRILVKWDNNRADVTQIKFNGKEYELNRLSGNSYYIDVTLDKSPQKIDIYADEYIRYEDIVQPYPAIINLKQDGKTITWGDKLKVGSDIVFVGSANLLPELYTVSETRYNGVTLYPNTIIKVEKSMVFDNARTYLKANEPNCILSPNRLRIPNSSYKILGYIPDLTGKGNHGKLNNFAYTEDSGVFVDGSIKFDSTDDHIAIPNIIGGKCVMAKVKINTVSGIIYDQRRANVLNKSWVQLNPNQIAFEQNAVSTYIDGILNHNVICSDLVSKTVNLTCELEIGDTSGTYQPTIGSSYAVGYTTNINLYEFMLFPDVPNEEEIKELNDIVGIEGNTDDLLTKINI